MYPGCLELIPLWFAIDQNYSNPCDCSIKPGYGLDYQSSWNPLTTKKLGSSKLRLNEFEVSCKSRDNSQEIEFSENANDQGSKHVIINVTPQSLHLDNIEQVDIKNIFDMFPDNGYGGPSLQEVYEKKWIYHKINS